MNSNTNKQHVLKLVKQMCASRGDFGNVLQSLSS